MRMKAKELAAKLLEHPDDDVYVFDPESGEYFSSFNPNYETQGLYSLSNDTVWVNLEDESMVKIHGEPEQTRKVWVI